MSEYAAVLGLEIHVQLATKSKMFCRCKNDSEGAAPNAHTCEVCLGLPGTLPVPNRTAVQWALKTAMALGCQIPEESKFDRKQYFYPDLPKGYQISQLDQPFGGPGEFEFAMGGEGGVETRKVGITRLHLEEDAGKLTHPPGKDYSLVDLNRAGTPLMEIVTDPIECSTDEAPLLAKSFLQELRLVMRYLEVSEADMEKGHLRADANISIRKAGEPYGAKVEIKNMNSFKFVERGVKAEIVRQRERLDAGEKILQETRGFDEASGQTLSQRSKEEGMDYRYFPEPDVPPLVTSALGLEGLRNQIVELPTAIRRRWLEAGVPAEVVARASLSRESAQTFENLRMHNLPSKVLAKLWLNVMNVISDDNTRAREVAEEIAPLLKDEKIQVSHIKMLVTKMVESTKEVPGGLHAIQIIERDLAFKPRDESFLRNLVKEAIENNKKAVADYQAGNENAKQALVGAVMKVTKGSANPTTVAQLIEKSLGK